MPQMAGRYKDGRYKGWRWQVYPDPASPTGYTKKSWNPADTSNGGKPVEYFGPHDYQADLEDDAEREATKRSTAEKDAKREKDDDRYWGYLERRADENQKYNADRLDREDERARKDRTSRQDIAKLDRRTQLELASKKIKEDRRQFDLSFGADLLKTGAQMRGPLNAFQGFSYARGVQDSGFSPFVAALRPDGNTNYGGGTASGGSPTPLTVNTLVKEMTGASGTSTGASASGGTATTDAYGRPLLSADQQAQLAPIRTMFEGGLANAKQGQIENLTEGEMQALISGGDYLGRDTKSDIEFWKRSRPGQRSGLAA